MLEALLVTLAVLVLMLTVLVFTDVLRAVILKALLLMPVLDAVESVVWLARLVATPAVLVLID